MTRFGITLDAINIFIRGIVESKVSLWRVRDMRTTSASDSALLHNQEVIHCDIDELRKEVKALKIAIAEKKNVATVGTTVKPAGTEEV
jgi:hypothetical protein